MREMPNEIPKHVQEEMIEGKEGLKGQIYAAVEDIAINEPLLDCEGDSISASYSNDTEAKNSKKLVDEALERAETALKAEHFALKHDYSSFDDSGAFDSWKVVSEKDA